jgi:hypothetical protein
MMLLNDFIGTGQITLLMLAIMALEAIIVCFYLKRLRSMLAALAAGAGLVLALRAALMQHGTLEIALFLSLSFIFHIVEVRQWLKMSKHLPQ